MLSYMPILPLLLLSLFATLPPLIIFAAIAMMTIIYAFIIDVIDADLLIR